MEKKMNPANVTTSMHCTVSSSHESKRSEGHIRLSRGNES